MKVLNTLLATVLTVAQSKLTMNADGKFKVIQITDIHYGENEKSDASTTKLMEKLFETEKPNLAVLTGDMVSGYAWDQS
jgi:predicted MPP superfamily phosphohydrolase